MILRCWVVLMRDQPYSDNSSSAWQLASTRETHIQFPAGAAGLELTITLDVTLHDMFPSLAPDEAFLASSEKTFTLPTRQTRRVARRFKTSQHRRGSTRMSWPFCSGCRARSCLSSASSSACVAIRLWWRFIGTALCWRAWDPSDVLESLRSCGRRWENWGMGGNSTHSASCDCSSCPRARVIVRPST